MNIQVQKTIPVRLKKGISGNKNSISNDKGIVNIPAVSAAACVVLFHKIPKRNIVAIPGVNNPYAFSKYRKTGLSECSTKIPVHEIPKIIIIMPDSLPNITDSYSVALGLK